MSFSAAIITVSDTRTLGDDASGDKLGELVLSFSAEVVERAESLAHHHARAERLEG